MVDIDFLALEYDKGHAVALVEYKHELAERQWASHPSYQAMIDLGNRAKMPVFAVRYADDFSWMNVIPLNKSAKSFLSERQQMTEYEWVTLLYQLRGRPVPESLFSDSEISI